MLAGMKFWALLSLPLFDLHEESKRVLGIEALSEQGSGNQVRRNRTMYIISCKLRRKVNI